MTAQENGMTTIFITLATLAQSVYADASTQAVVEKRSHKSSQSVRPALRPGRDFRQGLTRPCTKDRRFFE